MSKAAALLSAITDGLTPAYLVNPVLSGGTATNLTLVGAIGVVSGGASRILDITDASKRTAFDMTALTTGTTRTLIIPASDDTLVGLATTDSLTNKTLVAPVISTGLTASGSAANTFAASTGTFITSTGANSLSGAVTVTAATTPSLTTASGKTNSGFVSILGKTSGGMKLLPTDASGNLLIVTNAAVASADRTLTLPDPGGADSVTYNTLASSLASKTLVTPIMSTGLTATGSTDYDFSGASGAFLTSTGAVTLNGAVSVNAAVTPSITLQNGKTNTGFLTIKGKTSGGVKLIPADAMGNTLTVSVAAIATADRTLTLPDPGGADSLALVALAQTFTNKTLTTPTLTTPVIATGLSASGSAANTFAGSTGTFLTSSGANTLSGTTTVAANKNLLCAAGTTALDMSLGTGIFSSPTGANTLGGAVTVNAATTPSITLAAGSTNSGFLLVNGKTSGGLKLATTDASGFTLTVTNAAIGTADRTLTLPDPTGSDSVAYLALAQTFTNKTLTAPVLSGTLTGTYTLGGTPTFTSPTINTPTIVGGTSSSVRAITTITGDATATIATGVVALTKGSAAAIILAAPSSGQAGTEMTFVAGSVFAHVITATGLIDDGVTGGSKNTATLGAFIGACVTFVAYNLKWVVKSKTVCTIA